MSYQLLIFENFEWVLKNIDFESPTLTPGVDEGIGLILYIQLRVFVWVYTIIIWHAYSIIYGAVTVLCMYWVYELNFSSARRRRGSNSFRRGGTPIYKTASRCKLSPERKPHTSVYVITVLLSSLYCTRIYKSLFCDRGPDIEACVLSPGRTRIYVRPMYNGRCRYGVIYETLWASGFVPICHIRVQCYSCTTRTRCI